MMLEYLTGVNGALNTGKIERKTCPQKDKAGRNIKVQKALSRETPEGPFQAHSVLWQGLLLVPASEGGSRGLGQFTSAFSKMRAGAQPVAIQVHSCKCRGFCGK